METPTNSINSQSETLVQMQSSIQNLVLSVAAAELQLTIHRILAEWMIISESFQVATIIEKLPSAWNDFKNYLKHKRKEMSVEDLIVKLRIKEYNRGMENRLNKVANDNIANVVEVKKDFKEGKQLQNGSKLGPKCGVSKK
ncbi:hypothetical protein J1N35_033827 [Gossypium stocksii]|uniref:Uncharacterized protein n=1 Tax=Gossypium stocksii TaxID=47602 RepID=A0A9D3ZPV3_9ROSI|nr:hypothetical protein J1N35_033827 [Gossypium stocksii]